MNKKLIYFIIGVILFSIIVVSAVAIVTMTQTDEPQEKSIYKPIVQVEEEEEEDEEEEQEEEQEEEEQEESEEEKESEEESEEEPDKTPEPPVYGETSVLDAYSHLNTDEKEIYELIFSCLENYEPYVVFDVPVSHDEITKCMTCINMDHPELYWYSGKYTWWTDKQTDKVCKVEPTYELTESEIQQYDSKIKAEANDIIYGISPNATDYEKVQYAYEQLIWRTDYVLNSPYNQSILSTFLNHQTVCAGYAKAFQYILHEWEIPCAYITGDANNGEKTESHAWNIIEIDGEYYYVDVTWGDPIGSNDPSNISYDYLCRSKSTMEKSHTQDIPIEFPECSDESLNYYAQNGSWFDSYDTEQVQAVLQEKLAENEKICFAFSNESAYRAMLNDVANGKLHTIICNAKGIEQCSYSYTYADNTYTIGIVANWN